MKSDSEHLGRMAIEVDPDDPAKNVMALVMVTKQICTGFNKDPFEGTMMLLTAAAVLLDCAAEGMAATEGKQIDRRELSSTFIAMAKDGWNANAYLFKDSGHDGSNDNEETKH